MSKTKKNKQISEWKYHLFVMPILVALPVYWAIDILFPGNLLIYWIVTLFFFTYVLIAVCLMHIEYTKAEVKD